MMWCTTGSRRPWIALFSVQNLITGRISDKECKNPLLHHLIGQKRLDLPCVKVI